LLAVAGAVDIAYFLEARTQQVGGHGWRNTGAAQLGGCW
jgi:hypothetical protein